MAWPQDLPNGRRESPALSQSMQLANQLKGRGQSRKPLDDDILLILQLRVAAASPSTILADAFRHWRAVRSTAAASCSTIPSPASQKTQNRDVPELQTSAVAARLKQEPRAVEVPKEGTRVANADLKVNLKPAIAPKGAEATRDETNPAEIPTAAEATREQVESERELEEKMPTKRWEAQSRPSEEVPQPKKNENNNVARVDLQHTFHEEVESERQREESATPSKPAANAAVKATSKSPQEDSPVRFQGSACEVIVAGGSDFDLPVMIAIQHRLEELEAMWISKALQYINELEEHADVKTVDGMLLAQQMQSSASSHSQKMREQTLASLHSICDIFHASQEEVLVVLEDAFRRNEHVYEEALKAMLENHLEEALLSAEQDVRVRLRKSLDRCLVCEELAAAIRLVAPAATEAVNVDRGTSEGQQQMFTPQAVAETAQCAQLHPAEDGLMTPRSEASSASRPATGTVSAQDHPQNEMVENSTMPLRSGIDAPEVPHAFRPSSPDASEFCDARSTCCTAITGALLTPRSTDSETEVAIRSSPSPQGVVCDSNEGQVAKPVSHSPSQALQSSAEIIIEIDADTHPDFEDQRVCTLQSHDAVDSVEPRAASEEVDCDEAEFLDCDSLNCGSQPDAAAPHLGCDPEQSAAAAQDSPEKIPPTTTAEQSIIVLPQATVEMLCAMGFETPKVIQAATPHFGDACSQSAADPNDSLERVPLSTTEEHSIILTPRVVDLPASGDGHIRSDPPLPPPMSTGQTVAESIAECADEDNPEYSNDPDLAGDADAKAWVLGTTLRGKHKKGTTKLEVVDCSKFRSGEIILLARGTAVQEANEIIGLGSIFLKTPTKFDHDDNTTIEIQETTGGPFARSSSLDVLASQQLGSAEAGVHGSKATERASSNSRQCCCCCPCRKRKDGEKAESSDPHSQATAARPPHAATQQQNVSATRTLVATSRPPQAKSPHRHHSHLGSHRHQKSSQQRTMR